MEDKILFEIKESNLDTGLRGIPVGHCVTSKVDPQLGLSYRGYLIKELAYKEPEEIIYLILNGELPNANELLSFKNDLVKAHHLDERVNNHFRSLPKEGHPMKWFLSSINFLGMYAKEKSWKEDTLRAIATIPSIVGRLYQIYYDKEIIEPKPEMGYMENFVNMTFPGNTNQNLVELMRVFDILHFDHGGGNLSAFIGKAVSSGYADHYESLTGAMAALAGPLHGKANQECFYFIKKCYDAIGCPNDDQVVYDYLKKLFESGEKIFGFGHAVLRVEDTRATIFYDLGQRITPDDPYFKLVLKIRKVGTQFLSTQEKVSNPYPNVDAASGALLNALGFSDKNFFTVLFGMSRSVGIACQIYHDRVTARNGKGTPIVRPKYIYSGKTR